MEHSEGAGALIVHTPPLIETGTTAGPQTPNGVMIARLRIFAVVAHRLHLPGQATGRGVGAELGAGTEDGGGDLPPALLARRSAYGQSAIIKKAGVEKPTFPLAKKLALGGASLKADA